MKKLPYLLVLLLPVFIFSQQRDPRSDQFNFVPGELIVKLKDDIDAGVVYASVGQAPAAGKLVAKNSISKEVSRIIGLEAAVKSQEVLFSKESVDKSILLKQQKTLQRMQLQANSTGGSTSSSATKDEPEEFLSLKNVVKLELEDKNANILELVEKLKDNPNIEYIEPNYIFSINNFEIASDIIYDKDLSPVSTTSTTVPDDPLYSEQTNITQTNIDDVWNEYTTGDGSQIVAILDTGVDYTHPDLEANIWINEAELNGVEGYDDDGNGYVDDIRGWDFINNDNAPLDDNMHGTHVAGIVGAVGGNGIGVTGAAWNVKLMPIKVFQSNGVGNSSDIAQGVNYAAENGATIQNMSFGSYAESSTLKIVLETAYASSVLVGAAGNNGICIGPGIECAPFYPAAYNYVLGVEDSNGNYDNYDQDGPTFTRYATLLNYELQAPGLAIMSTVPNGGYRALTGTSMAAPLVSGAMGLYNQIKPNDSKELIFGNLINSSPNFDLLAALKIEPNPILKVISTTERDTINGQNGNGFWEPGETIEIFPLIKNYWGPTDDLRVGIEFAEFEDQSKATILESEIQIGSISSYASLQNFQEALKIKISNDVINNVNISFRLKVWSGPNQEYISDPVEFTINVKNSILLYGYYEEDLTLTPDKEYLVSGNFAMAENTTLTIEPGVELYISDGITISIGGDINAIGTTDNRITFAAENSYWSGINLYGQSFFKYCIIKNVRNSLIFDNKQGSHLDLEKCILTENDAQIKWLSYGPNGSATHSIRNSNIVENTRIPLTNNHSEYVYEYTNFINNFGGASNFSGSATGPLKLYVSSDLFKHNNVMSNMFNDIGVNPLSLVFGSGTNATISQPNYFGTGNVETAASRVIDFFEDGSKGIYTVNYAIKPSEFTNGIVWKVLVNGKDAQDEYDQMDPIGVGTHEFKVYFNRTMDTSVNPSISYGVRFPYTQKKITETGTWSEDGKIYTVNHEVNIGAADGINRIRVQDATDLDNFSIPIEDSRFNMLVQSAGSASTGFMATAGLGEITLDWTAPSGDLLDDLLGYNMYRYVSDGEGGFTDPVKVNENLITDVTFKDYDVVRDTQYFYKYKILRTSFEETDYSNAVSSELLTAALGDSNGDAAVNVLDVVNTVDYILGANPTPFVDYATDVNNDSAINVLDIVAIVDLILNASTSNVRIGGAPINYYPNKAKSKAKLYWDGKDLIIDTPKAIAGLQLAFNAAQNYELGDVLQGFESLSFTQDDQQRLMLYNMSQKVIPSGKQVLLSLTSGEPFKVINAIAGEVNGTPITLSYNENDMEEVMDAPYQPEELLIDSYSPNPTYGEVQVKYYLPKAMTELAILIYDAQGNLILNHNQLENSPGYHLTSFDLSKNSSGIYFMIITGYNQDARRYIDQTKIILK